MNDLAIKTTAIKKAHIGGNMDFSQMIANYPLATPEHIANNQHQQTLLNLLQLLGAGKLIFIDSPISLDGEFIQAQGNIGLVLENRQGQASNLLLYPPQGKPYLLQSFADDGLVLHGGDDWIAVESIDIALQLTSKLAYDENYTLIAPPENYPRQFENLVKAFAKDRQITVFCDGSNSKDYHKTYDGHNVRLAVITDSLLNAIDDSGSLAGVLADELTIIKELGAFKWGVPEPLADDKSKATPYPIQAFTGVLREAVEAIAYHAQVPQAMAGQCVLGALATMLQQYINAPFGDSEFVPVSLFLLTRGASTDGKNRSVRLSHHTIKNYQKELDNKYREDIAIWQAQKRATPRKELEAFLQDTPPPIQKTLFVSSGTLQGIINEMLNNNQKSMAWVTSDAGQFFGGYSMDDKNGNKTIADLSDVWSEGYIDNITKNNQQLEGNKRAYDLRFTLDLQGQDEIIRKPLADPIMNGQGFLPRFLFAFPDSMRGKRVYNTPERLTNFSEHDPRLQSYWQACRLLLDPLPSKHQTDSEGNIIKINVDYIDHHARQALADYQQSCENSIGTGGRLEKYPAYAGRMAENTSRIASLMAYFEGRTALTADDIKRASLLTDYSMKERMRYDTETTGGDTVENDSQKLINWIVTKASKNNVTMLNKSFVSQNCPTSLRGRKLEGILQDLESLGYIRLEQIERKKLVYINPCLFK